MAITPPAPTATAFIAPTNMREIVWRINPDIGEGNDIYDIFNEFTTPDNNGNLEVIKSKILITLETFQGEWVPQPNFGIPFSTVNQNGDNPDVLAQILVDQILTVQNVNAVDIADLTYVATTREFSATYNVNTVYGTTQINTT